MPRVKIERRDHAKFSGRRDLNDPDLQTLLDGDPLVPSLVVPDGPLEEVVNNEVSEALRRIKEEKRGRLEQFRTQVDPNFWVCLCFQNREQKLEFLKKADWADYGDEQYVDGIQAAGAMGIDIKPIKLQRKRLQRMPKSLRGLEVIK